MDRMVGQGGTGPARHRVLSVHAGPSVAVDREPRAVGRHWAMCGCVSGAFEGRAGPRTRSWQSRPGDGLDVPVRDEAPCQG